MEKKKQCPIMTGNLDNYDCKEDDCEWYHPDMCHCSLLVIAESLSDIADCMRKMES